MRISHTCTCIHFIKAGLGIHTVYGPIFQKEKKKELFDQLALNRVIWAHLLKREKRILVLQTITYVDYCAKSMFFKE